MTFTFTSHVLLKRHIWANRHTQVKIVSFLPNGWVTMAGMHLPFTCRVLVEEIMSLRASYTERNYLNR